MKVTAVLPVYNRGRQVAATLRSVLRQTHRDLEVIVIDDHSDDEADLRDTVESFADERVRLVRNEQNMNGAYSRNVGIENATGQFIAFVDSDDVWHEEKIAAQVATASTLSGHYVLYCRSEVFRRGFSEVLPTRAIRDGESLATYLFVNGGYMPTPSLFLPSELARRNLFNHSLRRHQDYDFLMRIQRLGARFYLLPEVLVQVYANHVDRSEARGASHAISLQFLNEYRGYFDGSSANYFWMRNVGFYMSRNNKRFAALRDLLWGGRGCGIALADRLTYALYYLTVNTFLHEPLQCTYLALRRWAK